jgi:hypothetical protein
MANEDEVLAQLIEKSHILATQVKRNIQKTDAVIDDKTVLALNEYYFAANAAADLIMMIQTLDDNKKKTIQ